MDNENNIYDDRFTTPKVLPPNCIQGKQINSPKIQNENYSSNNEEPENQQDSLDKQSKIIFGEVKSREDISKDNLEKNHPLGVDNNSKEDRKLESMASNGPNNSKYKKKSTRVISRNSSKFNSIHQMSEYDDEFKQENQFYDFCINDNIKNKPLKIKNNEITTTKYNIFTFLPRGLLYQFARLPNLYFLFTAIIQSIPVISPLSSITAIVPLIFVLGVSLIREAIEDLVRNNYDNLNNNEEVIVYRNKEFTHSTSKTLQSGEIVFIKQNEKIPADMVLICTDLKDGACYVETSSLDGEKNLKLKITNKKLQTFFTTILDDKKPDKYLRNYDFKGNAHVLFPDANLNQIDGNIYFMCKDLYDGDDISFPITPTEFLLKGSILKNTNWIMGIIIYTGMNNKIILNSRKPRMKMSKTEISMNYCLGGVFCFLMICCVIASVLHKKFYSNNKNYYENFLLLTDKITNESFLTFFTYFLLLNTMIPISLIVTIEIIKMIQGIVMEWDIKLFSFVRHAFCKAKTVSINEELGNVNFIFSDKTGTLTRNQLEFRFCTIGKHTYEYVSTMQKYIKNINNNDYGETIKFEDNYFYNDVINKEEKIKNCEDNGNLKVEPETEITKKEIEKEMEEINEYWTALALTNECMVSEERGDIKYISTSPDDTELVKAASRQGYKLINTTIDEKIVKIGNLSKKFKVLKVLAFSSDRKRMSIIVKDEDSGQIKLYIKGAEFQIRKRVSQKNVNDEKFNYICEKSDFFSKKGFRTLLVAFKKIQENDYKSWVEKFYSNEMDEMSYQGKNKLIDRCYEIMENKLELLGVTVVEDKLQDQVPETIQGIKAAGIKIWVLTGDKMSTVESIALSCNLLTCNTKTFKLFAADEDVERVKNDCYSEITTFFEEFQEYLTLLNDKYNRSSSFYNKKKSDNSNSENSSEVANSIINWEMFLSLKSKNLLDPFSIIIESPILCGLFKDEDLTDKFLQIGYNATTVICCRVSPSQKSQVVQKMKQFDKNSITLAIGDGGNDVSMIMEAHIGIGLYGEEGNSAAQASDFAIGEFKLLQRLLFFHGRTNLYRISNLILYFFYKNFVFTMEQMFFALYCLSSGQTLIDDWYITCYNLIFTSLPLCVSGLTDFDVKKDYGENEGEDLFNLYKESRDNKRLFTAYSFLVHVIKGTIISFILFYFSIHCGILGITGHAGDLWHLSLKNYIGVLIIVSINLMLNTRYIVLALPLVILISTFVLSILFFLLVHYGLVFSFNSKASIFPSLKMCKFYLQLFLSGGMNFIIDYFVKAYGVYFNDGLVSKFAKMKAISKKGSRSLSSINNKNIGKLKSGISDNKRNKTENVEKEKQGENSKIDFLNNHNNNYLNNTKMKNLQKKDYKKNYSMYLEDKKKEDKKFDNIAINKKRNSAMKGESYFNLKVSKYKDFPVNKFAFE